MTLVPIQNARRIQDDCVIAETRKSMSKLTDDIYQSIIIEGQMLRYCGPIFFLKSPEAEPLNVFNNGTFGLVDTGSKKLLVTCAHVWTEFLSAQGQYPRAKLAVLLGTHQPVVIPTAPSHLDTDLDLATFDMEPLLSKFSCRDFFEICKHSPLVVRPGDVLASLGYLAEARHLSPQGANFRYEFTGISVADVSGPFICVDVMKTKRFRDPDGEQIPHGKSLGGISGSPVYRLERNGILRLAGFVTSSVLGGIVRITNTACIQADGSISDVR
jgi:hypothetical protein